MNSKSLLYVAQKAFDAKQASSLFEIRTVTASLADLRAPPTQKERKGLAAANWWDQRHFTPIS
jgi:hypothetical protein